MIKNGSIQPFIIQTMVMRLTEKESMKYLADRRFNISIQHFYRLKKRIQESRFDRLSLIAKQGFVDQHLERIDQLELINQQMWSQYRKGNYQAMDALLKIADLQTYISPYYDASSYVGRKSLLGNK